MHDQRDPFDDGLGPDVVNRGGGKVMGGQGGTGGYLDPSYEDALRILGQAEEIPRPWEQRSLMMTNAEAADLAGRLTTLRNAAGAGPGGVGMVRTLGPQDAAPSIAEAVHEFIAALQKAPPASGNLVTLHRRIGQAGGSVEEALAKVCEHPGVRTKLSA